MIYVMYVVRITIVMNRSSSAVGVSMPVLPVVLITGASTGIGAVYADRFARRGHELVLVARDRARLERLAESIRAEVGATVTTVVADLNTPDGLARVESRLRDDSIDILVNNAGRGATTPLVASDAAQMDAMIALNVGALTRLTYAAVPRFIERDRGAIINIASVVAIGPELLNGVYGGTKAYVLALSRSLRKELAGSLVRVQVVLPGATATEFWEHAGTPIERLPASIVMTAEDMVDAALAGFDRGEFVTIPSLPNAADWDVYEAARAALLPNLSRRVPAERYRGAAPAAR
jgi:uncharacterized protein